MLETYDPTQDQLGEGSVTLTHLQSLQLPTGHTAAPALIKTSVAYPDPNPPGPLVKGMYPDPAQNPSIIK